MTTRDGRATIEVIVVIVIVYLIQMLVSVLGVGIGFFALAMPLETYPWTIITAVYAHAGPSHLLANLVGLLIFGFIVERRTTRLRFHAFVLLTGVIAAVAEVMVGELVGTGVMVLGISGAVFALMGYVATSNPVTNTVLDRLEVDWRVQLVLFLVVAGVLTYVTAGERVALVAHFVGLILGLIAGRIHILRV